MPLQCAGAEAVAGVLAAVESAPAAFMPAGLIAGEPIAAAFESAEPIAAASITEAGAALAWG